MTLKKIAITGGACSGKSTGMVRIREHLEKLGHQVFVIPEIATIVFQGAGRYDPKDRVEALRFQKMILQMQLEMEKLFESLATSDDTIILTDRGAMDSKAYMSQDEWDALMDDMGLNSYKLLNSYDSVIHLVTAADGAPEAYKFEGVRNETPEEAVAQDHALQLAYLGHGHHKIIDNTTDFPTKMRRAVSEICRFLGVPEPLEIERKFLVEEPSALPKNSSSSFIEQTYLLNNSDIERRVRKRSQNGGSIYTLTTKQTLCAGKRIEKEKNISGTEYLRLISMEKDPARLTVQKNRHCFIHDKRCYEMDEYITPYKGLWVLEVEVEDLQKPITFPAWISVVEEVTSNAAYSNSQLALNMPLPAVSPIKK